MSHFKLRNGNVQKATLIVPLVVLAFVVCINGLERKNRNFWFTDNEEGFSSPRGWPFVAIALANDEGAFQVDASIVLGGTLVIRDVFHGSHPHLAWNWFFLFLDLFVSVLFVTVTLSLTRVIRWKESQ